jgi:hypothetical protein
MNLFNKKTTVDIEKNRIPILNKVVRKEGEITGDMSVDEVAEIVSERMMVFTFGAYSKNSLLFHFLCFCMA